MSKVLVLGHGPLPFENRNKLFGPGIRSWQFARPLANDGNEVVLVCSRIPFIYDDDTPPVLTIEQDGVRIHLLEQELFRTGPFLQELHDSFQPDCIVAATTFPSYIGARLRSHVPLWADLFGDPIAESQAKSYAYCDDSYLVTFRKYVSEIARRADIISSVSNPQKFAVIGQLGMFGRLNRFSYGYEFVYSIPCAIDPVTAPPVRNVLRGTLVEPDDFVVLWSGGYNTWTDVDTLFEGLSLAMSSNSRIKFVSTGGQIDGHDEVTYPRFLSLVSSSPLRDRFVMCGWVPNDDVLSYVAESDVGINIDTWNYEALLGSRNRILYWMNAGLPVLTTETSEITETLRSRKLGYTFKHRDPVSMRDSILAIEADRGGRRDRAARARQFAQEFWTLEATTEPLRRWVKAPICAPDRATLPWVVPGVEGRSGFPPGRSTFDDEWPNVADKAVDRDLDKQMAESTLGAGNVILSGLIRPILRLANVGLRGLYRARSAMTSASMDQSRVAIFRCEATPPILFAGAPTSISVVVQNRGGFTWLSGDKSENPVNLSYHWSLLLGQSNVFDGVRTPFNDAVKPGEWALVVADVVTPTQPGLYVLEWDVVQEHVAWFGDGGSSTLLKVLVLIRSPDGHNSSTVT